MSTKPSDSKLYKYHVTNLKAIQIALDQTSRLTRPAIGSGDVKTCNSLIRLFAFLIGAWAECRLMKLIYEPNSFDKADRKKIQSKKARIDQWHLAVELAFRKQYEVPKAKLSEHTLSFTAFARFRAIEDILDADLRQIVEVRNKLAHGQWIYPLNI